MITIRAAGKAELPIVQRLAHAIWPSAYLEILGQKQLDYMLEKMYSLPCLEEQFSLLHHHFIFAVENGVPLGFASYSAHEDPSVFHLNKIYVLPHQQKKNIGKLMLEHVMAATRKAGAASLQLNVNRHNPALGFYLKQGFTILRQEDIDIGSGYFMNDYILQISL